MFCYFKGSGEDGLHLAYACQDELTWTALIDDKTVLRPDKNLGEAIMRDPYILKGPDDTYHLVYTLGWTGQNGIGYSTSKDLV